ncbi:MAG TPA: division/cell wall cluster transcriptional repressor MraZ [Stellaceae bacterium]|nr:division/cell wall cluster transcriptional repressor MraZ [Stellaceae bacterium]
MGLFLSTFVNKVDRKGRVSVPATFRATLANQSFLGIIAFPSPKYSALEGCGIDRIEEIAARIDALDLFSEERENFEPLLSESQQLPFDTEGRIILPGELVEHAKITDSVSFVGLGRSFQMWAPAAYAAHKAAVHERARQQGAQLSLAAADRRRERE